MQSVVPESVGLDARRLARIADVVQGAINRGEIAGASTLVMRHGQVAYSACQGLADLATRGPLQENAIYRIWSMSKPIAVVAALMLYERGLFGLYDPISRYIPAFANSQVLVKVGECGVETVPAVEGITIKQLMTHTSGLIYPGGEDEVARL
ncbi:MAG: beta-lactamase family protein [Anaerolineae bacterium]|nr:beta-lactamase family protein [Anaerolineae bacterium]